MKSQLHSNSAQNAPFWSNSSKNAPGGAPPDPPVGGRTPPSPSLPLPPPTRPKGPCTGTPPLIQILDTPLPPPLPDGWRSTFHILNTVFSSKSRPRMQEKCSPEAMIEKFPRGNSLDPTSSRAPLVHHTVLASWCLKGSTFWQIWPSPLSRRLATGLLAAMLSVYSGMGTVALAGLLL